MITEHVAKRRIGKIQRGECYFKVSGRDLRNLTLIKKLMGEASFEKTVERLVDEDLARAKNQLAVERVGKRVGRLVAEGRRVERKYAKLKSGA